MREAGGEAAAVGAPTAVGASGPLRSSDERAAGRAAGAGLGAAGGGVRSRWDSETGEVEAACGRAGAGADAVPGGGQADFCEVADLCGVVDGLGAAGFGGLRISAKLRRLRAGEMRRR